ncbi:MAG TPA: permease [Micromonosporaceae bacterium]|jgi:hypothetical protein
MPALRSERAEERPRPVSRWRMRLGSVELLVVVVLLAVLLRGRLLDLSASASVSTFVTVFVSVVVAGLPFLVLGAFASAALVTFVPRRPLDRLLTLPAAAVVPAAAAAGVLAPLGDDATEVAAGPLRPASRPRGRRDPATAGAAAFLLASTVVNPVVLVATAVAFPGQPMMVLARLFAGLLASLGMGWLWLALGRPEWLAVANATRRFPSGSGWPAFWERCRLDVVRAGGFLVLGALAVAVLTAWAPSRWLDAIGGSGAFAVVAMALLAVLLSVRGGPDAFVAAALSQFPATARLAFLIVGPTANLRLFTQQVARFGPRFALRFAPATLVVGLLCAAVVGVVLL